MFSCQKFEGICLNLLSSWLDVSEMSPKSCKVVKNVHSFLAKFHDYFSIICNYNETKYKS